MEIKRYNINEDIARTAKEMNSYRDYKPNSATNAYNECLEKFREAVNRLIERNAKTSYPATPEQMEMVEKYADRYSAKLAAAINRQNQIDTMCPSILITGGGNFPVQKKNKQNAAREKFESEYGQFYQPTDNYYYHKIKNILTNTAIYSNDALAIDKLKNKLADLEENQAKMKACNAYYRKNKTLKGYEGISDERAEQLDAEIKGAYSWLQQPFPAYQLTNNNAEIRRTKERIAELERLKEEAAKPVENKYPAVDGVEVVENADEMRIQLIFGEKPDEETRTLLKSNGFRWSPRFGAWQRQLNDNGIRAAKRVLNELQ